MGGDGGPVMGFSRTVCVEMVHKGLVLLYDI